MIVLVNHSPIFDMWANKLNKIAVKNNNILSNDTFKVVLYSNLL